MSMRDGLKGRRLRLPRHLLSIVILPFTMAVLIPGWLARRNGIVIQAPASVPAMMMVVVGAALLAIGLTLFASSLRRFASDGDGTLAPWDPPRKFVFTGPYRFVRNPMISGLIIILFGEAAVLRSQPHAMWALTFLAINAIYIPLFEEPQLRRRFGEPYEEYCRHVGRLVPRMTPWTPS